MSTEIAKQETVQNEDTYEQVTDKLSELLALPIMQDIRRLTVDIFRHNIELAEQIQFGFYANKNGDVLYIRGIEIDGSCNLLRSGFNGEDHGVFAHYTLIQNNQLIINDTDVIHIWQMLRADSEKSKFVKCTKRKFDNAVAKLITKANIKVEGTYTVSEYSKVMTEYDRLICKFTEYLPAF